MPVSPEYRDYVLEQLACVGRVTARGMFGGVGLYLDRAFFALIANDVVYFKVDDSNRADYETAGMAAFKPYPDRPMTMSYYEVPAEVLEDTDELRTWGRQAVEVARRNASGPAARGRPRRSTRSTMKPRKSKGGAR